MNPTLRLKLSVMMFLEYFIWGAWGVVIFTFVANLPTKSGLNFPGDLQGWIGATIPIGAMISPLFVGLFADRLFSSEKVLAVLHLLGAALLGYAAWSAAENVTRIRQAFETAARAEKVDDGNLLDALKKEGQLQKELKEAPADEQEELQKQFDSFQKDKVKPALNHVNDNAAVKSAVGEGFFALFGSLFAYAVCFMPTITLTNSLSFRNLSDPDKYFGSIRVLGTIGWIVAGWVVGFGFPRVGLDEASPLPLYVAAGASALLGVFCFFLPHTPPSGEAKTLGETLGLPAIAMLKDRSFLIFVICSFLVQIVLAFYYQQGAPFLTALEAPNPVAIQTIGQISEIFFMFMIPVGLTYLGTKNMLAIGYLAWVIRYAVFATLLLPLVIAVGLPLHGICFDFFFVVSYLYVDRRAPKNLRASAQGLYTFITLGVGWFLGNLFAGAVVQQFPKGSGLDWTKVWLVPMAGSALATILFYLLFSEPAPSKEGEAKPAA
jgi:nucleoside transporter